MTFALGLCTVATGFPVMTQAIKPNAEFFLIYYATLFFLMGVAISYIDIPIMYIMQNEIPEAIRGRVLSLVMSLIKTVLPFAFILSGLLIERIPVYYMPLTGGLFAIVYSIILNTSSKKKPSTLEPTKAMRQQSEASLSAK